MMSHLPPIRAQDVRNLNIDDYQGGVAAWGAVPPVYDTTKQCVDYGIHVHARRAVNSRKKIDDTFRTVRFRGGNLPSAGIEVNRLDAIYYMVASVFGFRMKYIECPDCNHPHLDRDWFSVHPHAVHLCSRCGCRFRDLEDSIGNPICKMLGTIRRSTVSSESSAGQIEMKQIDYPGGIQLWGSNPAFLWTSQHSEAEGIHIHAFDANQDEPVLDDTFSRVKIEGIALEPKMVRLFMVQSIIPHLRDRVFPIHCPFCHKAQFDTGDKAFTPRAIRGCSQCKQQFTVRSRVHKIISNPLSSVLEVLSRDAPRKPRQHEIDLTENF